MFDKSRLKDVLIKYKQVFISKHWGDEKFKWEAVKCFKDNWNVNSTDFADTLTRSLAKTYGLLASANNFPARMITVFAKTAPEEVRSMFIALFDENKDVYERIDAFKEKSAILLERYGNGAGQHYQYENAISTYLWLRYPDKYYIYKFSEIKVVADELKSDYHFKKGAYADNIRNFYKFYDEICEELKQDSELVNLLNSHLTDTCYPDPELKTLTFDVGFYISRYYGNGNTNEPPMADNSDDAVEVDIDSLDSKAAVIQWYMPVVEALLSFGGEASREDAKKKVIEMCEVSEEELSRTIKSGDSAVERSIEFARNDLCYEGFIDNSTRGIWKLTELGRDIIISDELAAKIRAKWVKIKNIERSNRQKNENRPIPEIDLTPYYQYRSQPIAGKRFVEKYSKEQFLQEVYFTEAKYDQLVSVLCNKKNIILQGAPGVGKTFAAKRLAYSMMGEKDESRIEFVQFHQSYSYEDFVMGYKPVENSFKLKNGVFYRFCKKADEQPDKDYFFIIDEINRGNMSKIFGELLMLIERDYRGTEATLAYNDIKFSVPRNLYIIGMMNTADRSLAMIDYALRRRFSFFEVEPGFDSDGFIRYQNGLKNETLNELVSKVKDLNKEIAQDKSLGKGFCIGHSYFCGRDICTEEWLQSIVDYDILPMLSEYWFDDAAKLQRWENILHGVFQ